MAKPELCAGSWRHYRRNLGSSSGPLCRRTPSQKQIKKTGFVVRLTTSRKLTAGMFMRSRDTVPFWVGAGSGAYRKTAQRRTGLCAERTKNNQLGGLFRPALTLRVAPMPKTKCLTPLTPPSPLTTACRSLSKDWKTPPCALGAGTDPGTTF